ncbi:hypothetical protein C2G38_2176992 [Gigaspora rosea]|uniref:Uncharacterized protein n=1 Tax=Gigaspora rosea TaxID=44941 RepID=A0A397VQ29_9GLOM|nr:hypothetical protein C2G38_2176992 [Gigaspora rosea]
MLVDRVNSAWKSSAVKVIHDSNKNGQVIQKLKNHCEIGYKILRSWGVREYQEMINYALKDSLQQNLVQVSQLEWKDKFGILYYIAFDLG